MASRRLGSSMVSATKKICRFSLLRKPLRTPPAAWGPQWFPQQRKSAALVRGEFASHRQAFKNDMHRWFQRCEDRLQIEHGSSAYVAYMRPCVLLTLPF